ncbi:MAG: right-handed parallel beta-helix repeat-containing protein [Promethearchaeota archaeon]
MKSNRKTKPIILIILGIFFAIFINNPRFTARDHDITSNYNNEFDHKNLKISAVSGKIHINNNWSAAKIAGICTGNGTYSKPYVIEDLIIDGGGSGNCIYIENSNVFFKIENCTVINSGITAGIYLGNVNNSRLINNYCSDNYWGIYLIYSNNNTVSGNTATKGHCHGIHLTYSNNNTVSGNNANNNEYYGILIYGGNDTIISGNTVYNNIEGISVGNSDNNIISGNTIYNNRDGISLWHNSDNNNISGNTIYNNRDGISLWDNSDNNNISGNTVNNNNRYGMYFSFSNFNMISGNTLIGNDECIVEDNCQGNTFSDNGECTYGQGNGGIPIEIIFLISVISGGAVIGVAALLIIRRRRKTID